MEDEPGADREVLQFVDVVAHFSAVVRVGSRIEAVLQAIGVAGWCAAFVGHLFCGLDRRSIVGDILFRN